MLQLIILLILSSSTALQSKSLGLAQITYYVPEEVPQGTRVGKLLDDIHQASGTYPQPGKGAALSLMFTNWQDVGHRHFSIDQTSGYLVVKTKPDREVLCPDSSRSALSAFPYGSSSAIDREGSLPMPEKIHAPEASDSPCTLSLSVVFSPERDPENLRDPILFTVNVVLTDINDHAPTFPQARLNLELGELSVVVGETTINLPTASDPDSGANGTLSYWLEHGDLLHGRRPTNASSFPFRLEGLVDGKPLRLRLIQPLDYEMTREYDFSLCVEDNGRPNDLSSRLRIHVNVVDENDNSPVFEQQNYFVIINESAQRGSVLLDIHATDADSGQNGQVSATLDDYSIICICLIGLKANNCQTIDNKNTLFTF